jgi:hypothetical protein
VWYTIECLDEHNAGPQIMSMVFPNKEAALANACALMKAGYPVSKVAGPDGFQMSQTSLAAYYQSRHHKPSLV